MFRLLLISLSILVITGCKNDGKEKDGEKKIDPSIVNIPFTASADSSGSKDNYPVMKFDFDTHDFGTIVQGEKVSYAYKFTNTGKAALVIRSTSVSCGCTVPEFSKDPVPPGGTGYINVTFNSEGKVGHQNKEVTVISNTVPNTTMISLTCDIVVKQ
jgi:hypothetical protein